MHAHPDLNCVRSRTIDANSIDAAIAHINDRTSTFLVSINLYKQCLLDAQFARLADCLLAHPDRVRDLELHGNCLTDETGAKLARFVAASSTIEDVDLCANAFSEKTHLAIASALHENSSVIWLYLDPVGPNATRIFAAFADALRINPSFPDYTVWCLKKSIKSDFKQLKSAADALGPPSMLLQLRYSRLDGPRLRHR